MATLSYGLSERAAWCKNRSNGDVCVIYWCFSRDFFSFLFFLLVPLPPLTCSPYTLVLPSLRYLSWLATTLWCREPLLHIVRLDSAFLPSPARVGVGSEPEGEESCPQPDHQARAGSRGRHGHGCQHRDPWSRHELYSCKCWGVVSQHSSLCKSVKCKLKAYFCF